MGLDTAIGWTDSSQNFWQGCTKVSAGCKFCYMYRDKERYGNDPAVVVRSADATFYAPLRKQAFRIPQRVFTCSWSDFFHEAADNWRADAWDVIRRTPHLTYQILTKRPERVLSCLPPDWGPNGYPNVWLGMTVENQDAANKRLPLLRQWPAAVRFVSFEPLLEAIDIGEALQQPENYVLPFEWAIIGGESGNETGKYLYRSCQLSWIVGLHYQLFAQRVPVFVKQLGTALARALNVKDRHGTNPSEWPQYLRIQQFPLHSVTTAHETA